MNTDLLIPMLIGAAIDSIVGDPYSMPHPIRLFGNVIAWCDRHFNNGEQRRLKGSLTALGLTAATFVIFLAIDLLLRDHTALLWGYRAIFFFFGISNRMLIIEALKVEAFVVRGDLEGARRQVGFIVGRDTRQLSFHQIRTATLETLAENLSDGVIAPLFYYVIGGIPLMMAYKMINTMDSMIGYKNERYRDFGWCAARLLDDTANYLPARITALLISLVPPEPRALRFISKYARHHASPNSGYPESAMAGRLDCRFGGPNIYHGKVVEKPYIGTNPREITHHDLITACRTNAAAAFAALFLASLALILA